MVLGTNITKVIAPFMGTGIYYLPSLKTKRAAGIVAVATV